MSKIRVLQLGNEDFSKSYPVADNTIWFFEPDMEVLPEADYDLMILARQVANDEVQYLMQYVKAYCLFAMEDVSLDGDTEFIFKAKKGEILPKSDLQRFLVEEPPMYFPKPYGEKYNPNNFAISPNYEGKIAWNGFSGVELEGNYGNDFTQIAYWRNCLPIFENNCIEFWLEYVKDDSVELQLRIEQFKAGSVSTIQKEWFFSEQEMSDLVFIESGNTRGSFFASLYAKGNGKLNIVGLHDRASRKGRGSFLPGGGRSVSSDREELFWYFDPGDMKPPLNVYFSGYKTQEGFEGYYMMRNMNAPFLLISEPRLEGGAFYLGSDEYEKMLEDVIQRCMDELGFNAGQLILSGLSMGTFGALYYGSVFRPYAIIVGKPLASLGSVANNERVKRPGGFPTSLDVLWKQYNSLDSDAVKAMNHRFWDKFDAAQFSATKFVVAYMIEDDYDTNAYRNLLAHLNKGGVQVYGKGIHGRHNDDTRGIVSWFVTQYNKILTEDFDRETQKRKYQKRDNATPDDDVIGQNQQETKTGGAVTRIPTEQERADWNRIKPGRSWKVFWSEQAKNAYLYGSEIKIYAKDDVEFKNRLIPPGTVIKSWSSKVNFQAARVEPSLPIIDGEGSYIIETNISCRNPEQYLLRLVFYDRYGTEAESLIVRNDKQLFRCPLKTYSYELQLICAGVSELHFHYITISEVTEDGK